MALDPVARSVLEVIDATFPKVETMTGAEARRLLRERVPVMPDPEPVAEVENRTIPGPAGPIPVRVYRPRPRSDGPLPAVVFFHGGGFVLCDLDTHDGTCRAIANGADSVVVSVNYRLAPEHRFPAAAEDAYAATAWVSSHAEELGADARRLAVAGDSAGGNLSAVVSQMARDRGGPHLRFQLLVYPVIDAACDTPSYTENAEGYFLTRAAMEWYWDQYLGAEGARDDPYASPLRAPDLSGLPPAMVITAEYDPLRDEGEAYGCRLAEAGVPTVVSRYDGVFHGFFSMGAMLDQAKEASQEAFAALRAALRV